MAATLKSLWAGEKRSLVVPGGERTPVFQLILDELGSNLVVS
jgi:hypothetical protein